MTDDESPDTAAPAAFAALAAIEAGQWDRYLLRLRAAIEKRRKTDEFASSVRVCSPRRELG